MKLIATISLAVGLLSSWAQPVLTPSTPALGSPAGALVPGSTVISAPLTGVASTSSETNLTVGEVSDTLLNMQAAMEQALPQVAAFNNHFDFAAVPGGFYGQTTAGNFSRNFGQNLATNFGQNFAMNLGANTGLEVMPPLLPQPLSSSTQIPQSTAGTNSVTRETLGALLVLQSDMERMLPLLRALNGTTNASAILPNSTNASTDSSSAQ